MDLEKIKEEEREMIELKKQLANEKKTSDIMRKSKDQAYSERNKLVAFLASIYISHMKLHPIEDTEWDNEWRTIICIHCPSGQLTWHIHDSEKEMFNFLKERTDPFPDCEWDGHTTEEKYQRLEEHAEIERNL